MPRRTPGVVAKPFLLRPIPPSESVLYSKRLQAPRSAGPKPLNDNLFSNLRRNKL